MPPISINVWSPAACPAVSLTRLKSSRSIIKTARTGRSRCRSTPPPACAPIGEGAAVRQFGQRIDVGLERVGTQDVHQHLRGERHRQHAHQQHHEFARRPGRHRRSRCSESLRTVAVHVATRSGEGQISAGVEERDVAGERREGGGALNARSGVGLGQARCGDADVGGDRERRGLTTGRPARQPQPCHHQTASDHHAARSPETARHGSRRRSIRTSTGTRPRTKTMPAIM